MIWIALFSQSGKEIAELSERLGIMPDVILTDRDNSHIWPNSIKSSVDILSHERICDYLRGCKDCIITLHGYLRILPRDVCNTRNEIYNSHPGDVIYYPILKGKDPQKKAYDLELPSTGVVIHKVDSIVDSGEVLVYSRQDIHPTMTLEALINSLRDRSVNCWEMFLKERILR